MTTAERVHLGITEVLDVEFPGWLEQIDLDRLDMGKCLECILGQLHPGYYFGYWNDLERRHSWEYRSVLKWMAAHGFTTADTKDSDATLTDAWKQAITALRS